jgi:hypothetical protein
MKAFTLLIQDWFPVYKNILARYLKSMEDIYPIVHNVYGNMKSFNDWWMTVPEDLRYKSRRGDEANKPLLNQVNYVLLNLHLAGKHDAKPSHEELRDWLHSGQVDVLRMSAK